MHTIRTLLTLLIYIALCTCVRAQECIPTATTTLEANGVRATLTTGGDIWWDGQNGGYIVSDEPNSPNGKQTNMMWAGGFWMAARDPGGNIKLAAQRYGRASGSFDYQPGPLNPDGSHFGDCADWDRFFKASRVTVDAFRSAWQAGTVTADNLAPQIAGWPASGNPFFAQVHGFELPGSSGGLAPFWDENRDGVYNPLDGDYPAFCGDQAVWWVFNDSRVHRQTGAPNILQVEVQVLAYAVASADDLLHRTTFYDFKIINRGSEDMLDAHAGIWVDPDIGCFLNDDVASDAERGIFFAHNQTGLPEENCGAGVVSADSMRPATIFQFTDEQLSTTPLGVEGRSFVATIDFPLGTPPADFTDPSLPEEYYNLLSGLTTTGRSLTRRGIGNTPMGDTTRMAFDGGPMQNGLPWRLCEALPGSFLVFTGVYALGPFDLPAGQSGTFSLAVSTIFNLEYPDNCPDDTPILAAADSVQAFYDNNCLRSMLSDLVYPATATELGLEVFPNPATAAVQVRLTTNDYIATLSLYDLHGKQVTTLAGSGPNLSVDLRSAGLDPGAYIYRVQTAGGSVATGRVVVQ